MSEEQQPVFTIEKIYVKDLSLEVPNAPGIFQKREAPEINVQLNNKSSVVSEGTYDIFLTVTVTAKIKEEVMFLVEVHQAGIFQIRNVPETEMGPVLGIVCPNILFPYARAVVSDTITRAGFPAVILNPVNFEAMYNHSKQQQAEKTKKSE